MLHSSLTAGLCGVLFLAFATAQREAPPLLAERDSVGDYIRAGLGVHAAHGDIKEEEECSDLLACASSWFSYSASLPNTTTDFGSYTTYLASTIINTTAVYGTGDVYTTSDGIPVAHGTFTPTRTAPTLIWLTTNTTSYISHTQPVITNTPGCVFKPADCSRLYVSYISSLGLPKNATVPEISPAPTNSPPCPTYYYQPFTTCYDLIQTDLTRDCKLYGNSVELFYFPSTSDGAPEPTAPPTYSYAPGTTFTSPSIYLSFDYISALRNIPGSIIAACKTCDKYGCRTQMNGAPEETSSEGTVITGRILTMAPQEVSSIVLKYNDSEASALIRTLVNNLPGYGDAAPQLAVGAVISASLTSERLRIQDIAHPPPKAYYLRPGGATGCNYTIQDPKCATIFEGDYRAIISLPSEASLLQDAWATCNPAIYGVYDPPIALTQAQTADEITAPSYQPSMGTYVEEALTFSPPLAAPGTALEADLPQQTSIESATLTPPTYRPTFAHPSSTGVESSRKSSAAPATVTSNSGAFSRPLPLFWSCLSIGVGILNVFAF